MITHARLTKKQAAKESPRIARASLPVAVLAFSASLNIALGRNNATPKRETPTGTGLERRGLAYPFDVLLPAVAEHQFRRRLSTHDRATTTHKSTNKTRARNVSPF